MPHGAPRVVVTWRLATRAARRSGPARACGRSSRGATTTRSRTGAAPVASRPERAGERLVFAMPPTRRRSRYSPTPSTRTRPTGIATSGTTRSARAASRIARISPRRASSLRPRAGEACWMVGGTAPRRRTCAARQLVDRCAHAECKRRAAFATPLERAADAYVVRRGGGRHDRRRLSVVHRLGPRHVHRAARPLPRDGPPRRRAPHPARVGGARRPRACCRTASPIGRGARVQRGRRVALVRRRACTSCSPRPSAAAPHVATPSATLAGAVDAILAATRGAPLRHPRRRRRAARRRRARRAAHLDGRAGRRLGGDAAHRQARRGPGAVAERAACSRARRRALARARASAPTRSFSTRFWNGARAACTTWSTSITAGRRRRELPSEPDLRRSAACRSRCSKASARAAWWTPSSASSGRRSACARWRPASPATRRTTKAGVRERDGAYHQGTVWPWLLGRVRRGVGARARRRRERRSGSARAFPRAALRASRAAPASVTCPRSPTPRRRTRRAAARSRRGRWASCCGSIAACSPTRRNAEPSMLLARNRPRRAGCRSAAQRRHRARAAAPRRGHPPPACRPTGRASSRSWPGGARAASGALAAALRWQADASGARCAAHARGWLADALCARNAIVRTLRSRLHGARLVCCRRGIRAVARRERSGAFVAGVAAPRGGRRERAKAAAGCSATGWSSSARSSRCRARRRRALARDPGGVLGVGIGFGLQNIANNFVSGVVISLERPIRPGDFVRVGELQGTVLASAPARRRSARSTGSRS